MRRLLSLIAVLPAASRGVSVVEFGMFGPMVFLLLVGLLDLGLGIYSWLQLRHAVSSGAQYAMVHNWDASAIANAIQNANATSDLVISFADGSPKQVCACPIGTNGSSDSNLEVLGDAVSGSCSSYGTCSACVTWDNKACPAGLYAYIHGQSVYTSVTSLFPSATLKSRAYGRIQ